MSELEEAGWRIEPDARLCMGAGEVSRISRRLHGLDQVNAKQSRRRGPQAAQSVEELLTTSQGELKDGDLGFHADC